jgi:hypothetical protein
MSALQNDKRQLETALVVEGTQAAAIKRAGSSAPRPPARCLAAWPPACLPSWPGRLPAYLAGLADT